MTPAESSPQRPTESGVPAMAEEPRLEPTRVITNQDPTEAADSSSSAALPSAPGTPTESATEATLFSQPLLGRYRLMRVLGKGGFANVYLAFDGLLEQEVAIKILKLGLGGPTDHERFLLEARIGAKLRHPNITTVYDIVKTADGLQLIMEYYPGGTLSERIRNHGPLSASEAVAVTRQVALALGYAHRRSVIHRDIKPANIFLAGDGIVKLGDFGIAANAEMHEYTQTGMIIGTPLYMAPEQANDSRDVDPRTDLYALGLTLYHMLTGRPPRVIDLESIPATFRPLIKASTEHQREARVASAEQFIAMLDQIELAPENDEKTKVLPPDDISVQGSTSGSNPLTPADSTPSGPLANLRSTTDSSAPYAAPPAPPAAAQTKRWPVWIIPAALVLLILAALAVIGNQWVQRHASRAVASAQRAKISSQGPQRAPTPSPTPSPSPNPQPAVNQPTPATATPSLTPTPEATATATPAPKDPVQTVQQAIGELRQENRAVDKAVQAIDGMAQRQNEPLALRQALTNTAMETLESQTRRTPANAVLHLVTAIAYDQLGKPEAARVHYYEAYRRDRESSRSLTLTPDVIDQIRQNAGITLDDQNRLSRPGHRVHALERRSPDAQP